MMRRKVFAIVVVAIVVISTALAMLYFHNCSEDKTSEQIAPFNGIMAEYRGKEYCEVIVDLGYVKPSATANATIRLTNLSDSPIVLLDYSTQCRCMWLEFNRTPIESNQSTDIVLTFDSRGEWGSVGNYMEITTSEDNAPVILWIGAEIE